MSSHHRLAVVLATAATALGSVLGSMGAQAQQAPPPAASKPSVVKDCKGLKDQALRECQKVARQMEESAKGTDQPETEAASNSDANDMHHSSPIMRTKEERTVTEARKQGKDPQKELEKLKKKDTDASSAAPEPKSPQ